jgi:thymidylate synthase (FAD)
MKAEYIDHLGTDLTVVNSARVSMNKESDWEYDLLVCGDGADSFSKELSTKDTKLVKYLATYNHWTPFSHVMVTMRETVPIFIARQRFKHMVGFTYNEVSRRYVDDDPEFYYPEEWRSRPDGSVKQGSGDDIVETMILKNDVEWWSDGVDNLYQQHCRSSLELYNSMIDANIAPEQARMVLPQSMYTSYYVTGSLAAWARAYKQRIDPHAQKEIRDLAIQWNNIIEPLYPVCWSALTR